MDNATRKRLFELAEAVEVEIARFKRLMGKPSPRMQNPCQTECDAVEVACSALDCAQALKDAAEQAKAECEAG